LGQLLTAGGLVRRNTDFSTYQHHDLIDDRWYRDVADCTDAGIHGVGVHHGTNIATSVVYRNMEHSLRRWCELAVQRVAFEIDDRDVCGRHGSIGASTGSNGQQRGLTGDKEADVTTGPGDEALPG
jgi:hypothetical protein